MPIVIPVRTEHFFECAVIKRTALLDNRLSWAAKGLHTFMIAHKDIAFDDFDIFSGEYATDNLETVKNALQELRDFGYIEFKDDCLENQNEPWEVAIYEDPNEMAFKKYVPE